MVIEYQTLKMENENNEIIDSQNDTETTEETETIETETLSPEELSALREKANKADELEEKNKQLYARLKKGETKKEDKIDSSITAKDVLILSGAGITNEEDVDIVERWAKFNKTSIRDALADSTLKSVIATKQEERRTAQATQTRGGQRGSATLSADVIIANASKGKLPESDTDIDNLAAARMAKKLGK